MPSYPAVLFSSTPSCEGEKQNYVDQIYRKNLTLPTANAPRNSLGLRIDRQEQDHPLTLLPGPQGTLLRTQGDARLQRQATHAEDIGDPRPRPRGLAGSHAPRIMYCLKSTPNFSLNFFLPSIVVSTPKPCSLNPCVTLSRAPSREAYAILCGIHAALSRCPSNAVVPFGFLTAVGLSGPGNARPNAPDSFSTITYT